MPFSVPRITGTPKFAGEYRHTSSARNEPCKTTPITVESAVVPSAMTIEFFSAKYVFDEEKISVTPVIFSLPSLKNAVTNQQDGNGDNNHQYRYRKYENNLCKSHFLFEH